MSKMISVMSNTVSPSFSERETTAMYGVFGVGSGGVQERYDAMAACVSSPPTITMTVQLLPRMLITSR